MQRTLRRSLLTGFALAAAAGCEGLLDVPGPVVLPPGTLDNPAYAPTMVQGVVADFECALANYITATALLTDELFASTTLGGPLNWDRRRAVEAGGALGCEPDNSFNVGVYAPLSTARFQADGALRRLLGFDPAAVPEQPGRTALVAIAAAYAGYAYAVMGEGFCEAAFDLQDAIPWNDILALAEQRFDTALVFAQAANVDSVVNMVLVGRARVRLSLGEFDPAKLDSAFADASRVPPGFIKHASYSTAIARRFNRVFEANGNGARVDSLFRNLDVDGVVDSRVSVSSNGRQSKYSALSSPIVIASWREAQLIMAEVKGGQQAVDAINRLRATLTPPLPVFASVDSTEIAEQVRVERKRELFLEGHRLNDMLRFDVAFQQVTRLGVPTGDVTCLRLPSVEIDNNPNITDPRRTTRD